MRVLLASTAGAGHFGPLLPFIETLARRGDEPVLVIPPELEDRARSLGFPYRLSAEPPAQEVDAFWRRFPELAPSKAAILVAREFFGRLGTAAMLPALEEALRAWRPELILHEPCAYAAAVVAVRSGIPHAQVAISLAKIEGSALAAAAPALETYGEAVVAAIRGAPYLTRCRARSITLPSRKRSVSVTLAHPPIPCRTGGMAPRDRWSTSPSAPWRVGSRSGPEPSEPS